jgi:4'-phosphopantetheinyl transferase
LRSFQPIFSAVTSFTDETKPMSVQAAKIVEVAKLPVDKIPEFARNLGNEIHLWHADSDRLWPGIDSDSCSDAERSRAAAFPSQRDGRRFLVTRALLRKILSVYTGHAPGLLRICVSDDGKPFVEDHHVRFSVSHSEARAVIAVRARGEAGVDVQVIRPVTDELALARSAFANSETARLAMLTGSARRLQFFRLWTCREAVLKTAGIGITEASGDLVLEQNVRGGLRVASAPPEWGRIGLSEFRLAPDSLGAVAWEADETHPVHRHMEIKDDEALSESAP